MMTTEIVSNKYINGQRISAQTVKYDKSDDLFTLANLQRQYENICTQIANPQQGIDTTHLQTEKTRLEGELIIFQGHIDGYTVI